jgi:nucleotide-binding universal stress UspA family protein
MKKILLPTDGSMECQKTLDIAEDLAKKFDGEITLFHVFDYHVVTTEEEGKKMLEKAVEYFEKKGVKVNSKIVKGYPAADIIDEAEKGGYDVMIMCTHGMTAGKRFLLGSVTNKVLHHVNIPMLIVR